MYSIDLEIAYYARASSPPAIEKRLNALAKSTDRSKSYYAREAILEHLGDLEDTYLAEKRATDVIAGRAKTTSLADKMKRYGMEG